ncbi:MAG: twin-arginine translocation signal domain-containing protein, partial [Actinomycetota bacterium]|nr:twin-arginine translocation signal domain-containing protein [Actinomycetota bacterium]
MDAPYRQGDRRAGGSGLARHDEDFGGAGWAIRIPARARPVQSDGFLMPHSCSLGSLDRRDFLTMLGAGVLAAVSGCAKSRLGSRSVLPVGTSPVGAPPVGAPPVGAP